MNHLNALSEKDKFYYAGVADTCVIVLKELGIEIPQSKVSQEINTGMFINDGQTYTELGGLGSGQILVNKNRK